MKKLDKLYMGLITGADPERYPDHSAEIKDAIKYNKWLLKCIHDGTIQRVNTNRNKHATTTVNKRRSDAGN